MEPFTRLTGIAVPLIEDNINTDRIAPIQLARKLEPDYRALLFLRDRQDAAGGFVLDRPQFAQPAILVAGENFGCGSSREAAVWAMLANGIRCIVARSFADIYRENSLQNGLLPVTLPEADARAFEARVVASDGATPFTVDLEARTLAAADGWSIGFDIPEADRTRLLKGLDDIGFTLTYAADIAAWEQRTQRAAPWYQSARDVRR
ncbi:MAG TPA: 3-isopropylmalate dehydratase small subunit [Xanthobacteraceae bacterium]|nr:3-isopropylmalate dehydratase small subunit [Xanthobacteraceae bacterium]